MPRGPALQQTHHGVAQHEWAGGSGTLPVQSLQTARSAGGTVVSNPRTLKSHLLRSITGSTLHQTALMTSP